MILVKTLRHRFLALGGDGEGVGGSALDRRGERTVYDSLGDGGQVVA